MCETILSLNAFSMATIIKVIDFILYSFIFCIIKYHALHINLISVFHFFAITFMKEAITYICQDFIHIYYVTDYLSLKDKNSCCPPYELFLQHEELWYCTICVEIILKKLKLT